MFVFEVQQVSHGVDPGVQREILTEMVVRVDKNYNILLHEHHKVGCHNSMEEQEKSSFL